MSKKDTFVSKKEASSIVSDSMYIYGMEVNENRALPRLEDGLKPVQRFITWAMHDLNAKNFIKSARISAGVIADWSPHGDASTYEALVNMVHDRLPLVDGQGNFGRPPNIGAASSRYTEARQSAFARLFISEKPDLNVIKRVANYDERREYPLFIPVRLPLLLLNGAEGIALALSTRIPPQNLAEMIKCLSVYLQNKDISSAIKHVKGPDYGSGRLLSDKLAVRAVYENGEGTLEFECSWEKEVVRGEKRLVISNFCEGFNPETFLTSCEKLIDDEAIDYARNDSSGKNGDRLIVGYSDDALLEKYIMPKLRKKINYRFNLLSPDDKGVGRPAFMNLPDIIVRWVDLRKVVIEATLKKELEALSLEIEKEEGKIKAIDHLDKIFSILKSDLVLVDELMSQLKLTKMQAETVAAMRVDALQRLSKSKIQDKITDLKGELASINSQLSDIDSVLLKQIKEIEKWAEKNKPELLIRGTVLAA